MRLLHRLTGAAREEPSLPVTGAIAGVLNMLPVGYVAGSKVTGMFVFGPTIGTSLNTTCCPTPAPAISASTSIPSRYQTRTSCSPVSRKACRDHSLGGAGPLRKPAGTLRTARRRELLTVHHDATTIYLSAAIEDVAAAGLRKVVTCGTRAPGPVGPLLEPVAAAVTGELDDP